MDPIADFLTRIRNANFKRKDRIDVPFSNIKLSIARIMKEEGFIANYKSLYNDNKRAMIRVFLKYTPEKEAVIKGLQRVSRPGRRIFRSYREIPKVRGNLGVVILSTPQGVITDAQAREKKVGGEILCQVW